MGRVARSDGHEVKSAEVKKDGTAKPSTIAETACHGLNLLNLCVEGLADCIGRAGDDGVDDAP